MGKLYLINNAENQNAEHCFLRCGLEGVGLMCWLGCVDFRWWVGRPESLSLGSKA